MIILDAVKSPRKVLDYLCSGGNAFTGQFDLVGTLERSHLKAMVGGFSEYSGFAIGLGAPQIMNLGHPYGRFEVKSAKEDSLVHAEVYNVFGDHSLPGHKVWVSASLSRKLNLRLNDTIEIIRTLDYQGRLIYDCERTFLNPFGRSDDKLDLAQSVIAAIDQSEDYICGLSATQLLNLDLHNPAYDPTQREMHITNELDFLVSTDEVTSPETVLPYQGVIIERNNVQIECTVYNARGMKGIGGCGIRISRSVAEALNTSLGDQVILYKHN